MTRGARVWGAVIAGGVGLLTAGCGSGGGAASGELPDGIVCDTLYRPDAQGASGQEEATVTVERSDGLPGAEEGVEFETMGLRVTYAGDAPEGRAATVVVTDGEGEELTRHLYQFGEPPPQDISFSGEHGFTGLAYVTHGDAQLQYHCEASA